MLHVSPYWNTLFPKTSGPCGHHGYLKNSSHLVDISSNTMYDVVTIEDDVTSRNKETYSDEDDCFVTGET